MLNSGSHRDCFLYKIDNVGLLVNTLKQGNVKKSRLYNFGNILFDIFRLFLCLRLLDFVNWFLQFRSMQFVGFTEFVRWIDFVFAWLPSFIPYYWVCLFVCLFVLWCLTQLPTIFRLYRSGHFYWWRTRRKPPTCLKPLTNLIA